MQLSKPTAHEGELGGLESFGWPTTCRGPAGATAQRQEIDALSDPVKFLPLARFRSACCCVSRWLVFSATTWPWAILDEPRIDAGMLVASTRQWARKPMLLSGLEGGPLARDCTNKSRRRDIVDVVDVVRQDPRSLIPHRSSIRQTMTCVLFDARGRVAV